MAWSSSRFFEGDAMLLAFKPRPQIAAAETEPDLWPDPDKDQPCRPTVWGAEQIIGRREFWHGAAHARRELRATYSYLYSSAEVFFDGERLAEVERLEQHCRGYLPLEGSRDWHNWFWRWRNCA